MSKAEEFAKEYALKFILTVDHQSDVEEAYIDGYKQSEKDLALGWEDIRELHIIFAEVDTEIELCKTDIKTETLGYYQEVLKRFKAKKENT